MITASSNPRTALCAFALLAGIVAGPAACTLDLQGKATGGAGGSGVASSSTSMSTSGSGGDTGTSTSTGDVLGCMPGTTLPCYDGPKGTETTGLCKAGTKTCLPDGTYAACSGEVVPADENCFKPGDEDCNGMEPKCTGTTVTGAQFASLGDEVLFAVAADKVGNVLGGGVFNSDAGGGVTVTKGFGAVGKQGPNGGAPLWARTLKSFSPNAYSVVRGVAVDPSNNVFIVGEFEEDIDDGNVKLNHAGGNDIFLIKLDGTNGNVLCQAAFGDDKDQLGTAIAADGAGNVFITGTMGGSFSFGGDTLTAAGAQDVFVARFDNACKHVWSKNFGDGGSNQVGRGVAATPQGDVVVVGSVQGAIDFGTGNLSSNGGDDVFVAKLSADKGTGLWSKRFGDNKDQYAYGVAVGADGSVVVTGTMFGKSDFGGGSLDAGASADAFLARFFADGSPSWSKNYGSAAEYQAGLGVTIDADKNIVLVGYFMDTLPIVGTTLTETPMSNKSDSDLFVAKLFPDGQSGWARSFGDINDQKAWAVTTNPAGEVIVAGTFEGGLDFGPPLNQFNSGGYDGFWVKFAP